MNENKENTFSKTNKDEILLVDDEPQILQLMHQLLFKNYEVYTATDAQAADLLLLQHRDIKVVVSDHYMPGEDGLSFLKRVRQRYPAIQTILMTGKSDEELLLTAINNCQLMQYLLKPQDILKLPSVVARGIHNYLKEEKLTEAVQEYTRFCLLKESFWGWWRLGPATMRFWLRLAAGITAALLFIAVICILSAGVIRLL